MNLFYLRGASMTTLYRKAIVLGLIFGAAVFFGGPTAAASEITGAGATFPYPIYAKWAEAYNVKTGNKLNYQSIGSGGGIRQIQNKTVDFGATDMPLKPEELDRIGLLQFPTVVGGDVPVVNLPGIKPGDLKLTGPVLADIYLGKIKKWNGQDIASLNPGIKLPDQDITVVHRSDGSGTTFIWVNYLSKVSQEWKDKVGEGTSVNWPVGVGGKGNEGVASYVQRINGAIGYVEYAYALQNRLTHALIKNRDGNFVAPNIESFKAAAAGAQWDKAPGMYLILTDQSGKNSWPISGATFILVYKTQEKADRAREVLKFFDWAYIDGDKLARDLDYVPLPDSVVKLIQSSWKSQIRDVSGKPVW
jgi:phosphate transport system substrate-binding protein